MPPADLKESGRIKLQGAGGLHKEVEVHGRADRVCAALGGDWHAGRQGVSENRSFSKRLTSAGTCFTGLGAVRPPQDATAGGGEPDAEAARWRPVADQCDAAGGPGKRC